ncbi:hypothetical protein PENSTE_c007G10392 [Penicillium steckii]|uniref:NmrA-like domain-containing protein n=1 Tax=Penicillium steckii TaxID=303698 RepID=A0A1V6TEA9_9EURO|nr:hypothetical protein PENSTE_c007G10392 [Penicillium steckii]
MAAATNTLEHFIWSTLPNTGGKLFVPQFEGKNMVDEFIKSSNTLLVKTTFLLLGFYQENFEYPFFTPLEIPGNGQYIQLLPIPKTTSLSTHLPSLGAAKKNIGLFVKAILEQPEKTLHGKYVSGYVEKLTLDQLLQKRAKVHGRNAHYVEIDQQTFKGLWSELGDKMITPMLEFHRS